MLARESLNSLNDLAKIFGKLKTNLNSTTACWISVFSILKLTEIPIIIQTVWSVLMETGVFQVLVQQGR